MRNDALKKDFDESCLQKLLSMRRDLILEGPWLSRVLVRLTHPKVLMRLFCESVKRKKNNGY